jgi:hypothetical protein
MLAFWAKLWIFVIFLVVFSFFLTQKSLFSKSDLQISLKHYHSTFCRSDFQNSDFWARKNEKTTKKNTKIHNLAQNVNILVRKVQKMPKMKNLFPTFFF